MAKAVKQIELGDIFRKNENYESLWVVTYILNLIGYPPHVHITSVKDKRLTLTYSTAALCNPKLFIKVTSIN